MRMEQTSERYTYMGKGLVQIICEGQRTPVWTYANELTVTPR